MVTDTDSETVRHQQATGLSDNGGVMLRYLKRLYWSWRYPSSAYIAAVERMVREKKREDGLAVKAEWEDSVWDAIERNMEGGKQAMLKRVK